MHSLRIVSTGPGDRCTCVVRPERLRPVSLNVSDLTMNERSVSSFHEFVLFFFNMSRIYEKAANFDISSPGGEGVRVTSQTKFLRIFPSKATSASAATDKGVAHRAVYYETSNPLIPRVSCCPTTAQYLIVMERRFARLSAAASGPGAPRRPSQSASLFMLFWEQSDGYWASRGRDATAAADLSRRECCGLEIGYADERARAARAAPDDRATRWAAAPADRASTPAA
ncbi:hypothetical protein EVAR_33943_1 [Eumeta japonica]|uniref:Uncharacterized protein n=1 Tax=Eumeta variegata TaxID=151549 RepID=A0A4C1W021_EUMVA|nr:hypothetical protein EVAR_33943_1 [Eumeta japonica]